MTCNQCGAAIYSKDNVKPQMCGCCGAFLGSAHSLINSVIKERKAREAAETKVQELETALRNLLLDIETNYRIPETPEIRRCRVLLATSLIWPACAKGRSA